MSKSAREWLRTPGLDYCDCQGCTDDLVKRVAWIEQIRADAFAAGAEAQREKTADRARNELMKSDLWVSEFIRETPLVTLPKGET